MLLVLSCGYKLLIISVEYIRGSKQALQIKSNTPSKQSLAGGVFYYYLVVSLSAYALVCVLLKRYSRISKRKYSFLSLALKCQMCSPLKGTLVK